MNTVGLCGKILFLQKLILGLLTQDSKMIDQVHLIMLTSSWLSLFKLTKFQSDLISHISAWK